MNRKTLLAAVALAGFAAAGCGSQVASSSGQPAAKAAGNPVPILQETRARIPAGTTIGETGAHGHRFASGYFRVLGHHDAETVTVTTFAAKAGMQQYLRQDPPSDTAAEIRGSGLYVVQVTGMSKNHGEVYSVTPIVIAQRVNGTITGGARAFTQVSANAPKVQVQAPATAPAAPVPPQQGPPSAQNPYIDPVTVVQNFYNALASGDYATAWDLGGKNIGGTDFNGWVAGYATTVNVYGTATDLGGGVVQVSFNAVQADGTVKTFSGTYTVSGGVIVSANVAQTA